MCENCVRILEEEKHRQLRMFVKDLTPLDYYLWGAVKDKCYVDKPETIDALKDHIREAIA